ncbi:unnamed protein product [Musa acuminata var. zebrina]
MHVAVKPLLVAGLKLRVAKAQQAFMELADASYLSNGRIMSLYGSISFFSTFRQDVLSGETNVITETGDSWFNCQRLCLPEKCGMQLKQIWERPAIAQIGAGSFKVNERVTTCMFISQRSGQRSIVFIINNGGYTIKVEIHDGPYNEIKNRNYTGVVGAINSGEGKCSNSKVSL